MLVFTFFWRFRCGGISTRGRHNDFAARLQFVGAIYNHGIARTDAAIDGRVSAFGDSYSHRAHGDCVVWSDFIHKGPLRSPLHRYRGNDDLIVFGFE